MLAVVSFILSGVFLLAALGFFKLIHDMRINALREADQMFEDHFAALDRFIKDPASPERLASLALDMSNTTRDPKFGQFASSRLLEIKSGNSPKPDGRTSEALTELEELSRHRPDLVREFNKAVAGAFFGAVYRHVAEEMSPFRAYREAKAAKAAKVGRKPDATARDLLASDVLDWCKAA